MTVLPIVGRELATASRRAGTYWLRFWVAAGALVIFLVPFLDSSNSPANLGQTIFAVLGSVMLGFSMLAGVFLTADSLSVEKREGTLGLLFLTDLKGYDVVLGKLAANSLHAFFGLLAVFPVLALPLLTGGLSGGEFWRTMLVFIGTMYFSLSIGMLVSAASQEGRQAMAGTFAAMVFAAGVLPVFWQMQNHFLQRAFLDFLLWPSPVYAYVKGFDSSYLSGHGRQEFWAVIWTLFLLGSVCIIAASILLPRSWRKNSAAEADRKATRFHFFGNSRRRRRPRLMGNKPFYWLASGDRAASWLALNRLLVLLGLLWAATLILSMDRTRRMYVQFAMLLAFGMNFAAKVLIASESGRRFHEDRQSGALELLLVTPLPVEDIVAGQKEALRWQFEGALLGITLVNIITFLSLAQSSNWEETALTFEVFLGNTVVLWLDAGALSWLGMWRGLKAKKYPRSVLTTWAQVILPPWAAFFFFIFIAPIFMMTGGIVVVEFFILLWFGLGVVIDLAGIARARENLLKSFRSIVSECHDG